MRISGKQLATGVAVALACALGTFSLAGCSGAKSPIHDEIEVAKADIASDVPSEIIEGWSFLAQNKDDSEAKRAIEELGGASPRRMRTCTSSGAWRARGG